MKKRIEIKSFWHNLVVMPKLVTIITTINKDGVVNAAPFSFVIPYDTSRKNPQILIGLRRNCHTHKNIVETKEFVMNFPTASHLEEIMELSKLYPEGVNELEHTTLTSIDSLEVRPPSIMECPQHIECTFSQNLGSDSIIACIIGNVVAIVVDGDLVDMDRRDRVEHLNLPIYLGDEERKFYYFGSVRKTTMLEVGTDPSMEGDEKVITHMSWEEVVLKRLNEIPSNFRQIVVDMVEEVAKKEEKDIVTHEYFMKMLEDYAPPNVRERFKRKSGIGWLS